MPASPRTLVDLILLGPTGDRRQLQDSPILGDVWLEFANNPRKRVDLLITPHRDHPAGPVAKIIAHALRKLPAPKQATGEPRVAYLQGLVAAKLSFAELLCAIVPRTHWWHERNVEKNVRTAMEDKRLLPNLAQVIRWAEAAHNEKRRDSDTLITIAQQFASFSAVDRYVALSAIILGSANLDSSDGALEALGKVKRQAQVIEQLRVVQSRIGKTSIPASERGTVWLVSLNRKVLPALQKSVPAVKGDAARTLFKVKCDEIRWAILDSGIDANHPALQTEPEPGANAVTRVIETYDFRDIRNIVSLDNDRIDAAAFKKRFPDFGKGRKGIDRARAIADLQKLAKDAENDRPIDWERVVPFIKVDPPSAPAGPHGTHVAGIIGAREIEEQGEAPGMCPDIKLLDLRVLGKTLDDTEFAIIAALQFIRYLNERGGFIAVHGANLSLSIAHDVRNFACGRTPICNECERLVESGVVVVAAAGNRGFHSFETTEGLFDSYAAFSITDPGNADGVITVGATHRFWPHTYGVSFFSSRGPTGDGRLKPDIVAPGEKIRSCVPGEQGWRELDGTSMAAPHVSGAAAMLMARYSELIGQPRKIKRILCESATDLGRERSFQGHGMLDVLRAFQKI